jgi:hypothetical protein
VEPVNYLTGLIARHPGLDPGSIFYPIFASMTKKWIPACAGTTGLNREWIPAFTGMTKTRER